MVNDFVQEKFAEDVEQVEESMMDTLDVREMYASGLFEVECMSLEDLLENSRYLAEHQAARVVAQKEEGETHQKPKRIDLVSLDIEGGEKELLNGFDFARFDQEAKNRPNIPLQEKCHRVILPGLRNISATP